VGLVELHKKMAEARALACLCTTQHMLEMRKNHERETTHSFSSAITWVQVFYRKVWAGEEVRIRQKIQFITTVQEMC
jgi:hypothetical protein